MSGCKLVSTLPHTPYMQAVCTSWCEQCGSTCCRAAHRSSVSGALYWSFSRFRSPYTAAGLQQFSSTSQYAMRRAGSSSACCPARSICSARKKARGWTTCEFAAWRKRAGKRWQQRYVCGLINMQGPKEGLCTVLEDFKWSFWY